MSHMRSDSLEETKSFPYSWAFTDKAFIRHRKCQVPTPSTVVQEISRWNPDITNLTNLDRQNFVLNWIQTTLGITLQQFLSANTSSARNKRTVTNDENLIINRAAPVGKDGYLSTSHTIKDPVAMSISAATYLRSLSIPSSSGRRHRAPTLNEQFWDQWYNGTLLSEVVAALLIDKKNLIKEVEFYDNYGRIVVPKKLLLIGTVHVVKSTAQMLNNMEICLKTIADHLPSVPPLKFFAQDIVYGPPDILWSILYTLYKTFNSTGKKNGTAPSSSGGSGSRRGQSPARSDLTIRGRTLHQGTTAAAPSVVGRGATGRSASAPPSSNRHNHHHQQQQQHFDKAHKTAHVHFSSSTKGSSQSVGQPGRGSFNNSSSSSSSQGPKSDLMQSFAALPTKRRSRSLSPVSVSRTSTGSCSTSRSSTGGGGGGGSVASGQLSQYEQMQLLVEARKNEKLRDRLRARAIDRRHRQRAIDELQGCTPSLVTPPVSPLMQDQFNATADKTHNQQPQPLQQSAFTQSTLETGGRKPVRQGWYPPPMTATELERVRLITPPTVTAQQQAQVKSWLASLQIYLLEGEGGYYSRVNHTPAEIPPPLPLVDDRLRNGVLLCGLVVLLERHAAGHVNLAALTHTRPTTLRMAMENLDRALWLFKMRRSPPIPLVFLSQPEEIIKCHKNLLWGLLYELMHAYPQGDTRSDDHRASVGTSNVQPRSCEVPTRESYEAEEQREQQEQRLPSAQTSAGGGGGRVKYSAKRRREVDVMLMSWLTSAGVLRLLYGSEYAPPLSVMALEAFVKDGSLLKNIITHILEIKVQCHARPTTFELCLSNTKKCIETLRRLGGRMNDRYLYVGVEEQLLRGDWDCILGLLEDVKQYADSIVKTPPVSVFQSQKALEMRFEPHRPPHSQPSGKQREVRLDNPEAAVDYSPEDYLLSNLCEFDNAAEPSVTPGGAGSVSSSAVASNLPEGQVRLSCEGVASRDTTPYLWGMAVEDEGRGGGGRYVDLIPSRHIPNPFDEALRQQQQQKQSSVDTKDFDLDKPTGISLSGPPVARNGSSSNNNSSSSSSSGGVRVPDNEGEDDVEFPKTSVPTPEPAPNRLSSTRKKRSTAAAAAGAVRDDSEVDEEEEEEADSLEEHPSVSRKNRRLMGWAKKLGVELSPKVDFSDGVVLHSILMKLVRCNPLPGFISSPRTNAHKIQNIRKSLEYLAANQKRIPLYALSCEEDILHNNFEAVCDLLRAIRKGYSIHQV